MDYLKKKSLEIRKKSYKLLIKSKKGHIGSVFSCIDILVSLYYGGILNISDFKNKNRDKFILSKGHACLGLFVILSDKGFFKEDILNTFCENNSILGGHPDKNVPGIEVDSGSLGNGLGIGSGFALNAKLENMSYFTYVLLGDGECNEGSVWESLLFCSQYKLSNLIAIVDYNELCATDRSENVLNLNSLSEKFKSFGWNTYEINGHNYKEILDTLNYIKNEKLENPSVVIAHTIKGKGISFMENSVKWHHNYPTLEENKIAKKEIGI